MRRKTFLFSLSLAAATLAFSKSTDMRLSITNERVEQLRRLRGEPKFVDLKDIFVLPSYRGRGYGKKLVEAMLAKLDHEEVPALMLATQDAHSLYRKLGFEVVEGSVKLMRRVRK